MNLKSKRAYPRKFYTFVKTHYFWISVILILVFAAILRFYTFTSRFAFESDQARDVLVVQEIIETGHIPLTGPPSSIGPFSYGPWYYWILSLVSFLFPFSILVPWALLTLVSVLFVFVLVLAGRAFIGNTAGIIAGLLAAVSTAEIRVSAHLSNLSFVSIFAALAILSLIFFLKTKRSLFSFLVGLNVAFAINMHLSAIIFLPVILPITFNKSRLRNLLLGLFGFLIPFIPLLISDFRHHWVFAKNLLTFFLVGQEKIWVSIRWLTYLRDFWPEFWSNVIGGLRFISYFIFVMLAVFIIKDLYRRKLDKVLVALFFTFILQVILLRYWRGEKQEVWLLFFNPLILLLTTWGIWKLFSLNKVFSIFVIIILMTGSLIADIPHLNYVNQFSKFKALKEELILEDPHSAFLLHNCRYSYARNASLPLLLLLTKDGKIDLGGRPIGVYLSPSAEEIKTFQYDIKARSDSYIVVEFKPGEIPEECTPITKSSLYNETLLINL